MTTTNVHVHMYLCSYTGSDSSPEDTNLAAAAAGIQAMVVKTKPRGRIPNPQECDKGNTKSKTDSKIQLRKKTRPCDGKFY